MLSAQFVALYKPCKPKPKPKPKSATVVIFDDPKRRVVSLLNEAHDDNTSAYVFVK